MPEEPKKPEPRKTDPLEELQAEVEKDESLGGDSEPAGGPSKVHRVEQDSEVENEEIAPPSPSVR